MQLHNTKFASLYPNLFFLFVVAPRRTCCPSRQLPKNKTWLYFFKKAFPILPITLLGGNICNVHNISNWIHEMCTWYSEIFLVLKITKDNLATIVVRSLAIITKKPWLGWKCTLVLNTPIVSYSWGKSSFNLR